MDNKNKYTAIIANNECMYFKDLSDNDFTTKSLDNYQAVQLQNKMIKQIKKHIKNNYEITKISDNLLKIKKDLIEVLKWTNYHTLMSAEDEFDDNVKFWENHIYYNIIDKNYNNKLIYSKKERLKYFPMKTYTIDIKNYKNQNLSILMHNIYIIARNIHKDIVP